MVLSIAQKNQRRLKNHVDCLIKCFLSGSWPTPSQESGSTVASDL